MPNLVATFVFGIEPNRECWHEAGHGVTAQRVGITVAAIGYTWLRGENADPNPSTWSEESYLYEVIELLF
jgi:hypothetical protein